MQMAKDTSMKGYPERLKYVQGQLECPLFVLRRSGIPPGQPSNAFLYLQPGGFWLKYALSPGHLHAHSMSNNSTLVSPKYSTCTSIKLIGAGKRLVTQLRLSVAALVFN